jgi:hypothetical protein|tara:strand:- start:504 stop:635 length:132 start_codon:yes stop_codon:yes gene_type:complete
MLKEFDNHSDNDKTRNLKRKVDSLTDGRKSTKETEKLVESKIK